jgi:hypothetical protein
MGGGSQSAKCQEPCARLGDPGIVTDFGPSHHQFSWLGAQRQKLVSCWADDGLARADSHSTSSCCVRLHANVKTTDDTQVAEGEAKGFWMMS